MQIIDIANGKKFTLMSFAPAHAWLRMQYVKQHRSSSMSITTLEKLNMKLGTSIMLGSIDPDLLDRRHEGVAHDKLLQQCEAIQKRLDKFITNTKMRHFRVSGV
jgi:hypothetical protein